MKILLQFIFSLVILAPIGCMDAVCQKCERIREENARKAKDQNWEFYEDWLELDTKETSDLQTESVSSENEE